MMRVSCHCEASGSLLNSLLLNQIVSDPFQASIVMLQTTLVRGLVETVILFALLLVSDGVKRGLKQCLKRL